MDWFKPRRRKNATRYSPEALEPRELLSVISVTNTNDSGVGSLRAAVTTANGTPAADVIEFDISAALNGNGFHHIHLATALPTVIYPLVIDGTSEPDYAGSPVVQLHGVDVSQGPGIYLHANDSGVRGLDIWAFASVGVYVDRVDNFVTDCTIWGSDNGVMGHQATSPEITGNLFYDNYYADVQLIKGDGALVSGNAFESENIAVVLYNSPNNEVVNNTMSGGYRGISATGAGSTGNNLSGNEISGMTHWAVFVAVAASYNTVQANEILGCWGGIVLTGGAVNYNSVLDNHIVGATNPLVDDGGVGNVFSGNVIE